MALRCGGGDGRVEPLQILENLGNSSGGSTMLQVSLGFKLYGQNSATEGGGGWREGEGLDCLIWEVSFDLEVCNRFYKSVESHHITYGTASYA